MYTSHLSASISVLYFDTIDDFYLVTLPTKQRIPEDDLYSLVLEIWNDSGVFDMHLPPIGMQPDEYIITFSGNLSEVEHITPGQYLYKLMSIDSGDIYAEGLLQFGLTAPSVSQYGASTNVVSYEPNTETE